MELDFLAFAAHPDDVELSMSGTVSKMINCGKTFGVIDLTKGELGTRGTIETRKREAEEASKILGLSVRENLGLTDGGVFVNDENTREIVKSIRKYKPKIIFAPHFVDRHPDHEAVGQLVKRAMFLSGLPKYKTEIDDHCQVAYRPNKLFYFVLTYEFEPTFIVDISETFETKMKSIRAYKTQFHVEGVENSEPETFISSPEFIHFLDARAKFYGFKIGKKYGEPFLCEEFVELDMKNYLEKI
jgi:bacillithiol biosynthesis deacetylase BshB1